MNCREAREQLLAGRPGPSGGLDEHLRSCESCAELAAGDGELARSLGPGMPLRPVGPEVFQAVQASLQAERGFLAWLRSRPYRLQVALAAGLGLALTAGVFFGSPRVDLAIYPLDRMLAVVGLLLLFGGGALLYRLRPLHLPTAPRRLVDGMIAITLLLPLVLALLPAAHLGHEDSLKGQFGDADFAMRAMKCLIYGTVFSLPLGLLLLALRRRVVTTRSRKLLAAAIVTVLGNLVLQFSCPITMPMHLLVGHAGLALIFGAVAWASRR
ncbi:MAG: hypothetical protein VX498_04210 [Myxococcota bacterium]|nr:hypothetical protein [Myxococcota bacterium]